MELCPQWLSSLCQSDALKLTNEEWLSFILGTLIVVFFAIDHYKIPTYAKTTIGDFIELAPESLTSAKRYRKGLYIYILLMCCLYLFFCFFWSKGLSAFLEKSEIKFGSDQLWPIAAATAVTLLGAMGDKNLFGRIETAARSVAHESAYIPYAVTSLSRALNGSFAISIQMAQQVGETSPALLAQITESQDGSIQTWIRSKYLYSRLELLRNDAEFQQLLNRPEHVRAFNFLNEERQNLADRVAQRLGEKHADLDEPLRKKVENFRSAVSVFLASLLWQGCGTDFSIQRKLTRLELLIAPADRNFLWNFIVRVMASLGAAAVLTFLALYLINGQSKEYLADDDFWHLTIAVLIFLMTALFATKRREARFIAGNTDNAFDAALASAFFCGLPIGFVAAITTFVLHQGGLTRFWVMLATGLFLAMLTAFLFEIVMRWAAQTPPTRGVLRRLSGSMLSSGQDLHWMLGRAVLLYAAASFVVVFVLFWVGEAVIAKRAPMEFLGAAERYLTRLTSTKGYSPKSEEDLSPISENDQNRFEKSLQGVSFSALLWKVKEAQAKVDNNKVDDIVIECDNINRLLKLQLDDNVLLNSCRLNGVFTRVLDKEELSANFRNAMLQLAEAFVSLEQFQHHAIPMSALEADWRRALAVAILWAFLSAVFAASILLFRRSVLWDTINTKTLNEYSSDFAAAPVSWLRTPIDELNNLTPLELIRYQDLRAALSDYLRASKPQPPAQLSAAGQIPSNGDPPLAPKSAPPPWRAKVSALRKPRLAARAPT
jgi:hypothetical protein